MPHQMYSDAQGTNAHVHGKQVRERACVCECGKWRRSRAGMAANHSWPIEAGAAFCYPLAASEAKTVAALGGRGCTRVARARDMKLRSAVCSVYCVRYMPYVCMSSSPIASSVTPELTMS
jgi:hypothetical protein